MNECWCDRGDASPCNPECGRIKLSEVGERLAQAVERWLEETAHGLHVDTFKGRNDARQAVQEFRKALGGPEMITGMLSR